MARFGVAGNPQAFYDSGFKKSVEIPQYLKSIGLDAYEYQCGKGVNISEKTAKDLCEEAKNAGIILSVHSPYYISLTNLENMENNLKYILDTLKIARMMDAKRVVVHSGSIMKMTREDALQKAKVTLKEMLNAADSLGLSDIRLCPETMGKRNQLGDLFEVIELCKLDERLIPTIDFGHLNARDQGNLKEESDFLFILDKIENGLGSERMKSFHSHFSKIEYTGAGEKRHLTFEDEVFGPSFEPLSRALHKKGSSPIIICESAGTQDKDALEMKRIYKGCF